MSDLPFEILQDHFGVRYSFIFNAGIREKCLLLCTDETTV